VAPRTLRNPLGLTIGSQTWPVPPPAQLIAKDFPGTIKQLADAGLQSTSNYARPRYADSGSRPRNTQEPTRKNSRRTAG